MTEVCRSLTMISIDVLRHIVHQGLEGIFDDTVIVGIDMDADVGNLARLAAAETGESDRPDTHAGCCRHRRQDVGAVTRGGDREKQIAALTGHFQLPQNATS